ncbi:transporter, auxin efflux carrier family protein [Entamoeba histolytica HM-1:IMSS-B]|uniref:Auxin efflux carrier family protein, putative n=6 Tax=Entamoeba histolytica TaxID=5759 RepID=C4M583_ENTH1|nr:auxin efflux carrier family protein, putative [Entamoeba histolytica HM-1:IMSS]EMD45862.1 auxin efflux carrier family protein [Entamoeba histolytica KU27]EMH76365.1 transporter, auxin efflux carrier family protein [Entamoeba histolytica HM-1:IMSS-B]EMS16550.1 auxin efflux carrier family protein [Entamoeba histolytica HM-3:IMSS]ENY62754.1 auxin efflux carrier family protein, putative [Entamoeba histolytica HM-1:IMSS-A]GAT96570.1 transporter auxin efflux carrier ec family [Entamoeba histolyti|eukprot:XP_650099.2 auxin efflux carrier family protein, putative [Entamoeba histolytica HM-1:IMSS]
MLVREIIKCACFAVIKIMCITLMGFAASKLSGFNTQVRSIFSKLIFTYFMPCVVLYQVATAIDTISELKELWILPVASIIHTSLQFFPVLIASYIIRIPKEERSLYSFVLGFANVMYIPMAVIEALTGETDELGENAKSKANQYICAYQISFMVTFFIIGYDYFSLTTREPENKGKNDSQIKEPGEVAIEMEETQPVEKKDEVSKEFEVKQSTKSEEISKDIETPKPSKEEDKNIPKEDETLTKEDENIPKEDETLTKEDENIPKEDKTLNKEGSTNIQTEEMIKIDKTSSKEEDSKVDETISNNKKDMSGESSKINKMKIEIDKFKKKLHKIKKTVCYPFVYVWNKLPSIVRSSIKNFFSPPTICTIIGVILMLLKWVRDPLFIRTDWSIIGRCINYMGSAAVFCALFLLGGSFEKGPFGSSIPFWKIVIGVFVRMVLFPAVSWVCTFFMWKYDILPSNKVFYFVLQMESFAPPAINGLIVVNVCYPKGVKSCSAILFWCYMFAILNIIFGVVLSMKSLEWK